MAGMKNKAQEESSGWTFTQMIMNPKYRLSLLIAMIFNAGQQFSGINAVRDFYYLTCLFTHSDFFFLRGKINKFNFY